MIENQLVRAVVKPATRAVERGSQRGADEAATLAGEKGLIRAEHYAGSWVDRLMARHPNLNRFYNWIYGGLSHPKSTAVIGNMGQLADKVFRGEQPSALGYATLKREGFDTVINLRHEQDWERQLAENNGLKYVRVGLPGLGAPTERDGLKFLSTVTDPASGKVFFHCEHGSDRTGAMAAIYRMTVQGWSLDAALAEMPKYGFHQGFEDANAEFVRRFARYWDGMSQTARDQVLHRS